jgi:hypothetical protein
MVMQWMGYVPSVIQVAEIDYKWCNKRSEIMHWFIEALIWSGLTVGCYFGYFLMRTANKLGEEEKADRIELLKAFFLGFFITAFCIVYAVYSPFRRRLFIVMNYAMPTDSF